MMTRVRPSLLRAVGLVGAGGLALSACGSDAGAEPGGGTGAGSGGADTGGGALSVAASFYPLQYVTQAVGGDRVDVTSLTAPGVEPHDLELAPQEVGAAVDADLLVTLQGFQSAVDEVAAQRDDGVLDVTSAVSLDLENPEGDADAEEGTDAEEELAQDPHFWLDPRRLGSAADAVAERLTEIDPDGASTYQQNAAALQQEMDALDAEYEDALADCATTELVTSHQAFGYLAERYGFTPVGISGLSPEAEPTPARLAEVADLVTARGVSTIYFETLVSPDIAQTLAEETGARTAVLDPIEGITEKSAGDDYPSVMRANLTTLVTGQRCA